MITAGTIVTFRPEFADPGDETISHIALDNESGGRVLILHELGMAINPTEIVNASALVAHGQRGETRGSFPGVSFRLVEVRGGRYRVQQVGGAFDGQVFAWLPIQWQPTPLIQA